MNTKNNSKRSRWFWLAVLLLAALVLTGCSPAGENGGDPSAGDLRVTTPEEARDAAMGYIRTQRPVVGLPAALPWSAPETLAGNSPSSITLRYSYLDWQAIVIYVPVELVERVYTVLVNNPAIAFEWSGLVDAYGNLVEIRAELGASPTPPLPSLTPSNTPSNTPSVTPSPTPLPSATPFPTLTPTQTASPTPVFSPTPTPLPCNAAGFVFDVTIPDGAAMAPNAIFNKTWRLRNAGSCTWTPDYDLVHVFGDIVGGSYVVALDRNVLPGQTIDLTVRLAAPSAPGDYRDFWKLRAPDGQLFGVGSEAEQAFWVGITVVEPSGNYNYDFAINICAAEWRSQEAQLRCDTRSGAQDGFVKYLFEPQLENRPENEPTLWLHPNERRSGWVEGLYPPYSVRSGEHFQAWAGCLAGYPACDVTFYLAYRTTDGRIYILQEWRELADGQVSIIDYDLTGLAGQTVQFILGMRANSDAVNDAQGFWFVPRIERYVEREELP